VSRPRSRIIGIEGAIPAAPHTHEQQPEPIDVSRPRGRIIGIDGAIPVAPHVHEEQMPQKQAAETSVAKPHGRIIGVEPSENTPGNWQDSLEPKNEQEAAPAKKSSGWKRVLPEKNSGGDQDQDAGDKPKKPKRDNRILTR
jgi:hypothetical protein